MTFSNLIHIIQIWHFGERDINFYCTLENDIARGASRGQYQKNFVWNESEAQFIVKHGIWKIKQYLIVFYQCIQDKNSKCNLIY